MQALQGLLSSSAKRPEMEHLVRHSGRPDLARDGALPEVADGDVRPHVPAATDVTTDTVDHLRICSLRMTGRHDPEYAV